MFFSLISVLGVVSIFNIPIEISPQIEYPKISITTNWINASPEIIEAYVTSPIESAISSIGGVKKISSVSSEGTSIVTVDFLEKTDIKYTRIEVSDRLAELKKTFPGSVSIPRLSQYVPKDFKELQGFLSYSVISSRNSNEIRKFADDNILPQLKSMDGIAGITIKGGTERLIEIIINNDLLTSLGISNDEINSIISESELIKSAGLIKNKNNQISISIENRIYNPNDIYNIPIKFLSNGAVIRIKDIAVILDVFEEANEFYRINGKEAVNIIIEKEPVASAIKTAKSINNKLQELSKSFPSDIKIHKESDKSELAANDLEQLFKSGLYSLLFIIIIISLIFGNIKYSLIGIISLVFSIFASLTIFYFFNLSINIITIAGIIIGFGFIIDNTMIIIDYLDKRCINKNNLNIAINLKNLFIPVAVSTLTIFSVFIPLIFLSGELQLYFKEFAAGIAANLFSSLIVSFTIVPSLFNKINLKRKKEKDNEYLSRLKRFYSYVIIYLLKRKSIVFVVLILLIGLPVWLIPNHIESDSKVIEYYNEFFDSEIVYNVRPYVNFIFGGCSNLYFNYIYKGEIWNPYENTFLFISLEMPNGTKIDRLNEISMKMENDLLKYRKYFKTIVANINSEQIASLRINFSETQAQTNAPYELKTFIMLYLTKLGGINSNVYGYGPGFTNSTAGASSLFNVTVKGYNYNEVKKIAEKYRDIISQNIRVHNIDIDKSTMFWKPESFEINAQINRSLLSKYNMTVEEVFENINLITKGKSTVSYFRIANEKINYQIKFANYNDLQIEELKKKIIITKTGENLEIGELIDFQKRKVISLILREDQQYIRNIGFEYLGSFQDGYEFMNQTNSRIVIPAGYNLQSAEYSKSNEEGINLLFIFIGAILIVFMITASLFESFKIPFIILSSIPFAFTGMIVIFYLGNFVIERGAYFGMLLLIGLSVSNSIVLLNKIYQLNSHSDISEVIEKSIDRIRALSATSATTLFAVIPFIISGDSSFWFSLSLSIAGGIITSYLYIIFIIPFLASLINKKKEKLIP